MTKNLLITGDSFCAVRDMWPLQFCTLLGNYSLCGTGFSGCSWWSSRKEIIKYLKIKNNIHTLVVLHTEPNRMPSDKDLPINPALASNTNLYKMEDGPISTAIKGYYKYLISESFYLWAYFNWFQELEVIINNSSVEKVVHLYCFPGPWTRNVFKKGITIQTDMISWSKRLKKELINDGRNYPNHLGLEGNELFAKRLHEVFTTRYQDSVGITDF